MISMEFLITSFIVAVLVVMAGTGVINAPSTELFRLTKTDDHR